MMFDFFIIIATLINFAIIGVIIIFIFKSINSSSDLLKQSKNIETKLDRVIELLEKKEI